MNTSFYRMKMRAVVQAAVLVMVTATPSIAQMMNLKLEGTVLQKFGGDSWWSGAGDGIGQMAWLELNYDAATPAENFDPLSATANYPVSGSGNWRFRFGNVDVAGALDRIEVGDTQLWLYAALPDSLTTLSVQLTFDSDVSTDLMLPTGPLPALAPPSPQGGLSGYLSVVSFDTLNLGGIDAGGLVFGVDAAVLSPRAVPVPEPGTYAGLGAVLLMCLGLQRRLRSDSRSRHLPNGTKLRNVFVHRSARA